MAGDVAAPWLTRPMPDEWANLAGPAGPKHAGPPAGIAGPSPQPKRLSPLAREAEGGSEPMLGE